MCCVRLCFYCIHFLSWILHVGIRRLSLMYFLLLVESDFFHNISILNLQLHKIGVSIAKLWKNSHIPWTIHNKIPCVLHSSFRKKCFYVSAKFHFNLRIRKFVFRFQEKSPLFFPLTWWILVWLLTKKRRNRQKCKTMFCFLQFYCLAFKIFSFFFSLFRSQNVYLKVELAKFMLYFNSNRKIIFLRILYIFF